ncbi:MAG: exo-alpha-sialidase [Chloroflexi bacterium]|nr:MAG: exo-alpha-sialidase [Chloroflexota bacterium]
MRKSVLRGVGAIAGAAAALAAPLAGSAASATYTVGPISNLSSTSCSGQNAEVEQAADAQRGYVYVVWMGCSKIAFSRSTDGGVSFSPAITVPGSIGSNLNAWDPAVTVAPDGTVYVAFMIDHGSQWYPVVDASFDHGLTFPQVSPLTPPDPKNWGDRDFLAVGPDGTVYVTWDYGPQRTSVTFLCDPSGSCGFATGDLNVVIQRSADRGASWSSMFYVSPGFPASGGDSAPMVIEPSGRIDVLYQGYRITDTTTYAMDPGYSYFTASTDKGTTWSAPVQLGPNSGTMSLSEWWIDGGIGRDAAGNLYAVWDTQGSSDDVGWLSFSSDGGRSWSAPIQAPADRLNVPHLMEVAGGGSGIAYVSWLSSSDPRGYALYLRAFSVTKGWISPPFQVSTQFGDTSVWPGDTTGLSWLGGNRVVASWGSAVDAKNKKGDIYAATVTVQTH